MNLQGFVCNAELPSSANIRNPLLNLWQQDQGQGQDQDQDQDQVQDQIQTSKPDPDPAFPVLIQVYVGALTIIGLYFIYRCAKR